MSTSTTDRLNDFPDRLSPMLVKELRQGLRGNTFVIVFLVLQVLLGLILLTASASVSSERAGMWVSKIVFVFFSVSVLVIQPLRGVGALVGEIRNNTIDLMVLTRLGALRIVLGKWVALVSQSGLIAITIFPYLILRYYLGGMNLFAELLAVLLVFFTSSCLTAVTVGLSGCRSVLLRGLLPLISAPFLLWGILAAGFDDGLPALFELCSLKNAENSYGLLFGILCIGHLGWSAITLGVSAIAPMAENHSTMRRILSLVILAAIPFLFAGMEARMSSRPLLWFLVAAPAIILALSEAENFVPTVYRPFTRRGFIGRFAGCFLAPGFPPGVWFTFLVVIGGVFTICFPPFYHEPISTETIVHWLGLSGSLLLPGMLVVLMGEKIKDRASCTMLLWVAGATLSSVMCTLAMELRSSIMAWSMIWSPFSLLPLSDSSRLGITDQSLMITGIILHALYLGGLLAKALPAFQRIRKLTDMDQAA